jgi:predicted YcjX-like family ATPase
MGRPAISRSTLRLSRVELSRAGMTAAIRNLLMQLSVMRATAHFPSKTSGF